MKPLVLLWYQYPNECARCVTQPPSRSVRVRVIKSSLTIALLQNSCGQKSHMYAFQKLPESLPRLLLVKMFLGLLTAIPSQISCGRCFQFKGCPLPLLSPSWVTPSTRELRGLTENIGIHWSRHLTQGKGFFNKGTSRHIRGHFPIDLDQSPVTWQRGLVPWLYQSSAISDSNAYRHPASLETGKWLRDWAPLKVTFVLISELLVLIPICKIFYISKSDLFFFKNLLFYCNILQHKITPGEC